MGFAMGWIVMCALVLVCALFIKFLTESKSRKTEKQAYREANTKKLRLELSAKLPLTDTPATHYRVNPSFLSKDEQAFYKALQRGLGNQFLVLLKVRVCDVLQPQQSLAKSTWQSAFNCIKSKHFDFVLCCPNQFEIIAAIELDNSSHSRATRQKRDKFLNSACDSAHFPLVRITARQIYAAQEIKAAVLSALRAYSFNKAA